MAFYKKINEDLTGLEEYEQIGNKFLTEGPVYVNVDSKPADDPDDVIAKISDPSSLDLAGLKTQMSRIVAGEAIKNAFDGVYYNNEYKNSRATKEAGLATGKLIRKHFIVGSSINELAKTIKERDFNLSEGTYEIGLLTDALKPFLNETFIPDIYNTKLAQGNKSMGPGELMLWAIYNNVDFSDKGADLLISNKYKVEIKSSSALIGTNNSSYNSAKVLINAIAAINMRYGLDDDLVSEISKIKSVGFKTIDLIFDYLKKARSYKSDSALTLFAKGLVNNSSVLDESLLKDIIESLKQVKTSEDLMYVITAIHFICYQRDHKFDLMCIFRKKSKDISPKGISILDFRSELSVAKMVAALRQQKIKPGRWVADGQVTGGVELSSSL